ncbi:hypothetical protein KY290_029858 [Solanum tuberosum]|uniref:Uncharacterized protein n=1 Tax=Solanum tuberosum TaxID=4113 RepID=A0ABQ7ULW3_SOLTU|nr:hypothetical protein KY289_028932 [Solanum tuberosum]KAH0667756.1 hypothetical protein KY285_028962 [Solanum tuberosum]KAH0732519.1 hypothetical protein KY289_003707 [Solanum tuberosum]KAH0750626.1 hypothetical protein KY290_029858 [Solanum tuberosum]
MARQEAPQTQFNREVRFPPKLVTFLSHSLRLEPHRPLALPPFHNLQKVAGAKGHDKEVRSSIPYLVREVVFDSSPSAILTSQYSDRRSYFL